MCCLDFASMSPARAYTIRRRSKRSEATRERIIRTAYELLADGVFNELTMEQVAERVGISRAALYQHFDSRLALVDAICDLFAVNPSLLAIRQAVATEDLESAIEAVINHTVGFWSSEETVLDQLYGVVAIDPSARALVDRQRADRRQEFETLARRLRKAGRLRKGVSERQALARLMILTSFETYKELGQLGLSDRERIKTLAAVAQRELLDAG
jgi:AcrR family transcriptional regulator